VHGTACHLLCLPVAYVNKHVRAAAAEDRFGSDESPSGAVAAFSVILAPYTGGV